MSRQAGFTLIEIIVSLVLVGIMATVVGMGLVTGTKGYLFAKENAAMAQKSQLALTRLSRELMELTTITSATATSILLDRVTGSRGIALVGDQIKIRQGAALPDAATGDILVDHVAGFTLTYFKGDQPWQVGTDDVRLLTRIQVDVILSRPESGGSDVSFTTTVNPRNNRSYGGSGPRWEF